ncbi:MAG: hypothetical protein MJE68_10955, partial [Proteobacteria bacterium]|nr:hypothetical protein [Pseudomonadota bacterium]
YTQPSTGTSSARVRVHVFEPPNRTRRDLLKMRDQHSIKDEHLLGLHPLHHQRSLPVPNGLADHQDPLLEYVHHQQPHGALPVATQGIQIQPQVDI